MHDGRVAKLIQTLECNRFYFLRVIIIPVIKIIIGPLTEP